MTDADSPRAIAARQNGAKSRGPKTPEGKARSSRNALKHGLTAERWVVLYDEDTEAFDALLEAWEARFEPIDDTEAVLVRRLAEADWRLRRATRIEFEMFTEYQHRDDDGTNALALAMIRDGHGANAFGNLLRYRGGAEREFHRLYKLLSEAKAAREAADEAAKRAEAVASDHEAPAPDADLAGEPADEPQVAASPSAAPFAAFRGAAAAQIGGALAAKGTRAPCDGGGCERNPSPPDSPPASASGPVG